MVVVEEQAYSQSYTKTNDGITGERIYLTDWADREDASLPSLGDGFPDLANCKCVSINIKPYGATTAGGGHEKARIIFSYSTAQPPAAETIETMEIGGEAMTAPAGKYSFVTSGIDVPTPPAEVIPQIIIVKSRIKTSNQKSTIKPLVGKLNDDTWDGDAAGLWLFLGASARHERDSAGDDKWYYDYRFQFKEVDTGKGWNYIYDAKNSRWDTTSPLLFQSGDFDTLGI